MAQGGNGIHLTFPARLCQRRHAAALPDRGAILTQARAVLGTKSYSDSADALHTRAGRALSADCRVAWRASYSVRARIADGQWPSIGAFPAAVIAGALDFASALRLVALRGT